MLGSISAFKPPIGMDSEEVTRQKKRDPSCQCIGAIFLWCMPYSLIPLFPGSASKGRASSEVGSTLSPTENAVAQRLGTLDGRYYGVHAKPTACRTFEPCVPCLEIPTVNVVHPTSLLQLV